MLAGRGGMQRPRGHEAAGPPSLMCAPHPTPPRRRSNIELQRLDAVSRSPIYTHFSETLSGVETIPRLPPGTALCVQQVRGAASGPRRPLRRALPACREAAGDWFPPQPPPPPPPFPAATPRWTPTTPPTSPPVWPTSGCPCGWTSLAPASCWGLRCWPSSAAARWPPPWLP